MTSLDEKGIREVLSRIDDPELKRPLTDLGMVRSIRIEGPNVLVGIALTVPGCPMKDKIQSDIVTAINEVSGIGSVTVEFDVMDDLERARLKSRLGLASSAEEQVSEVSLLARRFVAIASGKGGVGKSTVTVNLAVALARLGRKVGLLDADVYGFSVPRMLGMTGRPKSLDDKIIPLNKGDNLQVVSMGFFVGEDEPIIWRGPLLHKTVNQFLTGVHWSDLEYMLIDLPPGTGDVTITIAQAIPGAELLLVTTPQVTATHVAGRVAGLAAQTDLKVAGVIENMSYYESAGQRQYIFGQDGGKHLAESLNVPLLGQIPLLQSIREGSDSGAPVAINGSASEIALFEEIARRVDKSDR